MCSPTMAKIIDPAGFVASKANQAPLKAVGLGAAAPMVNAFSGLSGTVEEKRRMEKAQQPQTPAVGMTEEQRRARAQQQQQQQPATSTDFYVSDLLTPPEKT